MITDRKINTWTNPVTDEADRPQRAAADMKAVFDSNSDQLRDAHNGLIDDLSGESGASNIGSAPIQGLTGTTIWAQLADFFGKVFGIVKTDQPANRFLDGTGNYTVPAAGEAANGLPMAGANNNFLLKDGAGDYAAKWANAESARAALNVANEADNTGSAISTAESASDLLDGDIIPIYKEGLKKTPLSSLKNAVLNSYFNTAQAADTYAARISHGGNAAYFGIRTASEPPITQFYAGISASGTGPFVGLYNPSGMRRALMAVNNADDTSIAQFDDPLGGGAMVGTQLGSGGGEKYRGLWLYGSSGNGIATHLGHNATSGRSYLWMKDGDGTSAVRQIYIESTESGGKITLRGASGNIAAEIIVDPSAGGQIKLYNAAGTLKETVG